MKDTKSIIDKAYPEIESKLKKNLSGYNKYISRFMADRTKQFYSTMPSEQIYFNATDVDDFFNSTGIDRGIIKSAIEHTYYYDIGNFNPRYAKDECTVSMLCVVKYFNSVNKKKELELALINMSFSGKYYPSIWYGSYPVAAPQEHIMDYVINNMCSNKFDIVREGNVIGAIRSVSNTWVNAYPQKLKEFHDDDVVYLIQQLHNRIRSFMNNIAELYYEAYENKDSYITYDSDDLSEDNFRLTDNDSFKISNITENTINEIVNKNVDYVNCKRASNDTVKFDELRNIIDTVTSNNDNIPILKEFISLMISLYFSQAKFKNINDISFISFSIKPTPNSKDKNVIRKKELMDIILINNSENFSRRRNRKATESAYYRAFNAYIALMIQKANK